MHATHPAPARGAWRWAPALVLVAAAAALALHGPIPQPADYHGFADRRPWLGIANAGDVLSNLGFAIVGAWLLLATRGHDARRVLGAAAPGYTLFAGSLVLTAAGSAYYHLAPDNATLVWDRLPIALACAGLLSGARAQTVSPRQPLAFTIALALGAAASVGWWAFTESAGTGDLRAYLLLQAAPLVLVPLWQAIARAPRRDRLAFAAAVALYLFAKGAEISDRAVLEAAGIVSGHTLKHVLATLAMGAVGTMIVRSRQHDRDASRDSRRA